MMPSLCRLQRCLSITLNQLRYYGSSSDSRQTGTIDVRSDIVAVPSAAMRQVMAGAILGSDIYGDDPNVTALEKRCAELFNMEAALLVSTGTMGNLIAIMGHCTSRGAEMLVGNKDHIHKYEQGGYAQLAGVAAFSLPNADDGTIPLDYIAKAIRDKSSVHQCRTALLCLENTHNACGGLVLPLDYLEQVHELCVKHDIKVHMDGARLLNASVASKVPPADLVKYCDSVQMCFSKGLGAPAMSIVSGKEEFINGARRSRKALGGGMRPCGFLAAAASLALDTATETLTRDHEHAKLLADGVTEMCSPRIKVGPVQTNIVMLNTTDLTAAAVCDLLKQGSPAVLCQPFEEHKIRLVTHRDLESSDIYRIVECLKNVLDKIPV